MIGRQSEIQKINNYHSKKRQQFINNYRQKKETTMKDLCCSMDVNYQDYLDFKNPFNFLKKIEEPQKMKKMEELKKIEDKDSAQYRTILNKLENKRINAVNNYKEERDFQNIIDSCFKNLNI